MRERRYVKFKVDIYDDTKTKIIDQRPERDFIHYFFARSIVLAGKADCEGYLYMAKNIPYTIENLAIEFNREVDQIKVALDVLIELQMIEVVEGNIYKVKGFVKHQNIKVKEKVKMNNQDQEEESMSINNKGAQIKENNKMENNNENEVQEENNKNDAQEENQIDKNENCVAKYINSTENIRENEDKNPEIIHPDIKDINSNINEKKSNFNVKQDNLVILEMKDNKKSNKRNNKNNKSKLNNELAVEEIEDDNPIFCFSEGELPPLSEGEKIISKFSFN